MVAPVVVGLYPIAHLPLSRTSKHMHNLEARFIGDSWIIADPRIRSRSVGVLSTNSPQPLPGFSRISKEAVLEIIGVFGGGLALIRAQSSTAWRKFHTL
jgi:hypothetical protein